MYSFSQNFEDVYIYRAFREVTDGFYIDVGAFDPIIDSVTKMLYDLGWSGINLEPGPSFPNFASRVRDVNLPCALTTSEGEAVFHYNASDPATSTTTLSNLPEDCPSVQSYKVNSTTLEAVVRDHAADKHIHFLKLDIEGAEWDILRSTDWHAIRPELIIAESCLPYTNQRRDAGWADHMKSFGYHEIFFDGINTYYLREESLHRNGAFQFPVNVLDGIRKFDPYQHYSLSKDENTDLIKSISQEVGRVVEAESSAVRGFLESDLGPGLRAQKDLVEKLTSEQSEHFSHLRAIASDLSGFISDAEHTDRGRRGGNSIEAVIEQVGEGVSKLVEQQSRQAAEVIASQEAAEDARAALREQEKRVDEARAEVRLLGRRLSAARASRNTMIEMTERVIDGLEGGRGAPNPGPTTGDHGHEPISMEPPGSAPNSTAQRIARARTVPVWRRLIRFRSRAWVRRADSDRDGGRFAEAAEGYARSYALRPDRADLCLQMANMLTQLRIFDLAEDAYREALAKAPGDGLILLHLGHMLELSGRPAEARDVYLESSKLIPDHPDLAPGLSRTSQSQ
ncbi:FkbM family methyltransferase [Sphingomonas sp.]|uniref:FkbM family methyltransferase n=1 Tax=Sphingomonas sp. TaxID=28214 RepID=UPI0038A35D7F